MNGGIVMDNIKYFAYYSHNGELINIGVINTLDSIPHEITKEEYDILYTEILANIPSEEDIADPAVEEALTILRGEVEE